MFDWLYNNSYWFFLAAIVIWDAYDFFRPKM